MTGNAPLRIVAEVDKAEHGAVRMAVNLLGQSLDAARPDETRSIKLALRPPGGGVPPLDAPPHVIIASLLPELARPRESRADTARRWADCLSALQEEAPQVFLCTIFRHVPDRDRAGGTCEELVRIRALNLMAVELSHALGVAVIDVDRALAHLGARMLRTDFRLNGSRAALAAGHAMACALLAGGLDEHVDPLEQEKARALLGGLAKVPVLIRRHEQALGKGTKADG